MFTPRKKCSRKGKKEARKGKECMFTHRRHIFNRRAIEDDVAKPWAAVGTWFLGPKAENADVFTDLMTTAMDSHFNFRKGFYPCDPPYVTDELRQATSFKVSYLRMKTELERMQKDLHKSVPFFSTRYKGHVNWDTAVPANLGYIASILWNQNNCAGEGGPVTTGYEVEAGSDLCEMVGLNRKDSMGHLVTGGSVANIEAIWVARNLKYYPLGLQEALLNDDRLAKASGYQIYLPQRGTTIKMVEATQWELLNLDTDCIIKMPFDVADLAGLTQTELRNIMDNYIYESIGAQEFCRRHQLTKPPCVVVGSSYHVSFLKAMNIVGLGKGSLVTVPVDNNARMDTNKLKLILLEKMTNEIPVISVISIMGTTEESAVDPLEDIFTIRAELSKMEKGLNFSIHADAAWGAYFCCMLRDAPLGDPMPSPQEEGFVPELFLNNHVKKQLMVLNQCDTITVDPHKSGFCPYPAGAICYRDKNLNNFLSVASGVVYYHGDINLGDVGIEGSKPGAAACGVLLANKVIGLHKNGYGRILSECMFTSKILYCYWVCMTEDFDNFVLETTKALPSGNVPGTELDYVTFIRERILLKTNEELANDAQAMQVLQEIGPDTLIPCFSVNICGNKDVNLCNDINAAIFNDLCHDSTEESEQRMPMIVTSSTMKDHQYGSSLEHFKERLGLDTANKDGVKYIITTCLDPWSTSMEFMDDLAGIMRNTILNAIGTVTDTPGIHSFVSTDVVNAEKEIFLCYAGDFKQTQHQYFATEPKRLHDLLYNDSEEERLSEKFDFFVGLDSSVPFMTANMKVVDVPRYDHLDKADDQYPDNATYLLYGDINFAYLFHTPTKDPDYLQIVRLQELPKGLGEQAEKQVILKQGVDAELLRVSGAPTFDSEGKIVDPLTDLKYDIHFVGIQGEEVTTGVVLQKKIWFDGEVLNKVAA
ncbi:hypothetical protein ACROYT_G020371 [Oculina patagonica]